MANKRRSFSEDIILSDRFLSLPLEARYLYMTLGVVAREKGELNNARFYAKVTGCGEKSLDYLIAAGYLIPIDEYGFKIVDWYENNSAGEAKKRLSYSYRQWRQEVLKKDGLKCAKCGATSDLQVHHIKHYAEYPELRLVVSNGVTLCRECHKALHRMEREYAKQDN